MTDFLSCKAPTAATLIKRRNLELLGYRLVSVPFWEWDGSAGVDERRQYLEDKLQCNVGVDSAALSRQAASRPSASSKARVVAAASGGGGDSDELFSFFFRTVGGVSESERSPPPPPDVCPSQSSRSSTASMVAMRYLRCATPKDKGKSSNLRFVRIAGGRFVVYYESRSMG
jgi:hypothetical protein